MAEIEENGEHPCFVGKAPCGCYRFAMVNDEHTQAEDFSEMARMVKAGWKIEIKPVKFVWDGGLNFNCGHIQAKACGKP
jgi:hypothetical protein